MEITVHPNENVSFLLPTFLYNLFCNKIFIKFIYVDTYVNRRGSYASVTNQIVKMNAILITLKFNSLLLSPPKCMLVNILTVLYVYLPATMIPSCTYLLWDHLQFISKVLASYLNIWPHRYSLAYICMYIVLPPNFHILLRCRQSSTEMMMILFTCIVVIALVQ